MPPVPGIPRAPESAAARKSIVPGLALASSAGDRRSDKGERIPCSDVSGMPRLKRALMKNEMANTGVLADGRPSSPPMRIFN